MESSGSDTDSLTEASESEGEGRFTREERSQFEKSADATKLRVGFFFIALLYMWPYQTCVQTQNFLTAKFPEKRATVGNVMMLATTFPFLIIHCAFTLTGLSRRARYSYKCVIPGILVFVISVYLISVFSANADGQVLLNSLYVSALLLSLAEGVTEPAVYDMAGLYPSPLTTQSVMSGNGAAGVVVSFVNIAARLIVRGLAPLQIEEEATLSMVYFAIMAVAGLGIPAIYVFVMRLNPYFRRYVSREPIPQGEPGMQKDEKLARSESELSDLNEGVRDTGLAEATCIAARHIWPSILAVIVIFLTSLSLWPVIPGIACIESSSGPKSTLKSWWFELVLLTFNLADLLGKSEPRTLTWGARTLSPKLQLGLAVARAVIFFPLMLTAAAPQSYAPSVARWTLLPIVFLLGLSNGWLATVCFMRAPQALPAASSNSVAEQASSLVVAGLFAGISAGCLTAYWLGEGPLKEYEGQCWGS